MKERPKINLPMTSKEWVVEILCVLAILTTIVLLVINYVRLPERVPSHFDFSGAADGWGSKSVLFMLPCLMIGLYLVMTIVARFPRIFNMPIEITEENAEREYRLARGMVAVIKLEIVLFMALFEWQTIKAAAEGRLQMGMWYTIAFVGVIFATIAVSIVLMFRKQ
ncbi:MAG: DUF1648 domain-containing protein [Clostridia bacterium]|nr:DUF1648 domain-containing protein [Clostridia bacterium]MDR3643460.1 DUF1648 domain-containing protein [Clostridia bacterium]